MIPAFSEPDLESVVKVEPEQFEIVKDWQDHIPKCSVNVYDVFKPVVRLHRLDAGTISRWKKIKTVAGCFSCDFCLKLFYRKSELEKHIIFFHLKKFGCSVCGLMFERKGFLDDHLQLHDDVRPCPICGKKVKVKRLQLHKYGHNKYEKKKACPICGLFFRISYLKFHIKTHEFFRCRECNKVLKSAAELNTHLLRDHFEGKGHECFCGNVYENLAKLRRHQDDVHFLKSSWCEICELEFKHKYFHWNKKHKETYGCYGQWRLQYGRVTMVLKHGGPYICDCCGKKCPTRQAIIQHLKLHHGPKKIFSCDLCPKTYIFKQSLNAHIKNTHVTITKFSCERCAKKFTRKGDFLAHLETHNEKKKCKICRRLVADMKGHLKRHSNNKKVPCAVCGDIILKDCMARHLKNRHDEKPKRFKCEDCDEAFPMNCELIDHKKEKHGFKMIACHCNFTKNCRSKLHGQHQAGPESLSTFPCSVCGLEYKKIKELRSHWKAVHSKSLGKKKFFHRVLIKIDRVLKASAKTPPTPSF